MAERRRPGKSRPQSAVPQERKDWRRPGGRNAVRGHGDEEAWQAGPRPDPRYSRYRYLIRMIGATAVLAVLLGAWFFFVTRPHNQVPLYAIVVTDYQSRYEEAIIPPNALAAEDLKLLEQMFQRDSRKGLTRNVGLVKLQSSAGTGKFSSQWIRNDLATVLGRDDAKPGGPGNDVVMFYISAHGAVNANNEPCLLMSDADPLDGSTWVPLKEVLKSICDVDRFRSQKKLVFLDASKICENWQMGILCNTFPAHVDMLVRELARDDLVVINSAKTGEDAWIDPENGCSAFGRIVADVLAGQQTESSWLERLMGWSDITLDALQADIKTELGEWSREKRGAVQTAEVYYQEDDLPDWKLADCAATSVDNLDRQSPIAELEGQIKGRAKVLGAMWEKMDQLATHQTAITDPRTWAFLQTGLAQLEQLMAAGTAYEKEYQGLQSRINSQLDALLAAAGETPQPLIASFPLARQLDTTFDEAQLSDLRSKWADQQNLEDSLWDGLHYLDAVDVGLSWLSAGNHNRDDWGKVIQLVDRSRGAQSCDVIEIQLLKMFRDDPPKVDLLRPQISAALRSRILAEQAVAPSDPRALYWVEDIVKQNDVERRRLEDQLLYGDQEQQEKANRTESGYQQAVTNAEKVSRALRVRDQAWAEIPHLIQWKLRTERGQLSESGQSAFGELLQLVKRTHDLDQKLSIPGGQWDDAIGEDAIALQEALNGLYRDYDEAAYNAVNNAANDGYAIHGMTALLAAPIRCGSGEPLSGKLDISRGKILQRYAAVLFDLQTGDQKSLADDSPILKEMCQWRYHPLTALLDAQLGTGKVQSTDSLLDRLHWESQETKIRNFLKTDCPSAMSEAVKEAVSALRGEEADPALAAHHCLLEAESLYRRSVPVASAVLASGDNARLNPPILNRQVTRLRQLLFQERRVLDDCYLAPQPEGTFVELASEGYRRAANDKLAEISTTVPSSLQLYGKVERIDGENLPALASERQGAVGLVASAGRIQLKESDDELDPNYVDKISHTIEVEKAPDVPADGVGFVEFRLNDSTPFEVMNAEQIRTSRLSISTHLEPRQLAFTVTRDQLRGVSDIEACTYFRGKWNTRVIPVRDPNKGVAVFYDKPDYPDPRITVRGDARKPALVVFVLDCSDSMQNKLTGEEGSTTRMLRARAALTGILRDLTEYQDRRQGDYLVDLVLYGHRARWLYKNAVTDDPKDWGLQQGYDTKVHPNNDIEPVFGMLKPLDQESYEELEKKIDGVQHFGVTPLYGSLRTAINLITSSRDNEQASSRHVIAITDGVNETPSTPKNQFQVTADSVEQLADREGVQIDIIQFDVQSNPRLTTRQFNARMQEMRDIAESSGGQIHVASAPGELTEALRDATAPARFSVETSVVDEDVYKIHDDAALGQTWIYADWDGRDYKGHVMVDDPQRNTQASTNVMLEGGEHLQLLYDGARIMHDPYDIKDLLVDDPREGLGGGRFDVSAPVSEWLGEQLCLRLMVRNSDVEKFSPRPKHAWVEVTPVGADKAHKKFVFYDLEFEPNKSVPIFLMRTLDWPIHITEAEIKLWFIMGILDQEPVYARDFEALVEDKRYASGVEGIEFEVEDRWSEETREHQFIVWEHYGASVADDMPLTLVQLWPPPDHVEHEYRYEDAQVRHVFRYNASSTRPELRILHRDAITDADTAITVPDPPIRITLPRRNR